MILLSRKRMKIKPPLTLTSASDLRALCKTKGYKSTIKDTNIGLGVKLVVKHGKTVFHFYNSSDIKEFLK